MERSQSTRQLFDAVKNSDSDGIKEALRNGADVNEKNVYGETPLFYATIFCNTGIAKLLIDSGADVNEKADCGETPLGMANLNDDLEMVNLLIERGADINIKEDTYYLCASKNKENTKLCLGIAIALSALIIATAFLTQTYIILAALVIPAIIGLYGWSLYKEENKPDSKFQENIELENISTFGREAGA